jgi:glycosyltransferase involved in cell wall biosynthesis
MKIAVNTRLLLESRMEGIARYNYESLKRMVEAHPEDEFFFIFDRPYSDSFIFADNVKPIRLFPPTRHPFLIIFWFEWAVKRTLDKLKPDVFLSGDTYMSLRSKIPTLLVCHDIAYVHYPKHIPIINRNYYRYFFPKFHQKAKAIIAVSEYTKSDIVKHYKVSPEKVTVAYNAPNGHFHPIDNDEKERTRKELTNGEQYFVYLGSIHPRKNLENLIRGFDHFKRNTKSNYRLLIVGRPAWNTASFYRTLENSPYKEHILHKQFQRKELPKYIGSAEALCYVSLFEGFGIPILEGFEAEVPVITSNISSMPEVAGEAALLVDPVSPEEIGQAMGKISSDPNLRQELIQKGRSRLQHFCWENTASILYSKLSEIVQEDQ